MKKMFWILTFFLPVLCAAQVAINVQLPPAGLTLKSQLWNILLVNSSTSPIQVHAELRLTEQGTNSVVMTATTALITLAPGSQVLQVNAWSPIQYNIIDPAYQGFGNSDFLPVGRFLACYSIIKHTGDRQDRLVEDCEWIEVQPLGPPQLVFPTHQSTIETIFPLFNWLPPSPVQLFTGMNYELNLVEVYEQQTEADAIQQNIPLFNQYGITGTTYPYPAGAPMLEKGKKYAWRILVKNNLATVAATETWWFTIGERPAGDSVLQRMNPFAKLKKDGQFSYTIAENELKFEYVNEAGDINWNATVRDLTGSQNTQTSLPLDGVPLKPGQNLVRVALNKLGGFTDKHIYLLEIKNSRSETWSLKFEYRRNKQHDN